MSETTALTEQHRQAQLQVRNTALRDFLLLWPLWNGDRETFASLVQATLPLIRVYKQASAAVAASYYQTLRSTEGVVGRPSVRLAATVDPEQIISSLYVTGQVKTRDALNSGAAPEQARKAALTRVSGAVSRHVLTGGRETVLNSVAADKRAIGWARVTDGDPCYFCLTLASRGAVYKTEQSASFEAHDHCGCSAMPVFDRATDIPGHAKWAGIYDAAQAAGIESGDLQHGENSSAERLNAVRRYLATTT